MGYVGFSYCDTVIQCSMLRGLRIFFFFKLSKNEKI